MTAKPYTVASPLEFDGRRYEPGEPVDLAADIAGPLIADGVLADPDAPAARAALSGELERALDSIRRAPPDQIRAFFERLSEDDGIRAKFDAVDSTPPGGTGEEGPGSESGAEEEIEELACFGRHFDKADPDTYRHRIIDAVLQDEHGWREWFEAERLSGRLTNLKDRR